MTNFDKGHVLKVAMPKSRNSTTADLHHVWMCSTKHKDTVVRRMASKTVEIFQRCAISTYLERILVRTWRTKLCFPSDPPVSFSIGRDFPLKASRCSNPTFPFETRSFPCFREERCWRRTCIDERCRNSRRRCLQKRRQRLRKQQKTGMHKHRRRSARTNVRNLGTTTGSTTGRWIRSVLKTTSAERSWKRASSPRCFPSIERRT